MKETKELLDASVVVGKVAKELKDGFQLGKDGAAIFGVLLTHQAELVAAFDGVNKVLPELKAAGVAEKLEVLVYALQKAIEQLKALEAKA